MAVGASVMNADAMGGRLEERLEPARERLLEAVREGEVEVGGSVTVLDLTRLDDEPRTTVLQKLNLVCSACGYGIARAEPPERCPMCHAVDSWGHLPWRPFSGGRAA